MQDNISRQIFRVYDPKTYLEIGQKYRVNVHSEGDWHLAVTGFVFRKNTQGELEVLVQERSQYVDIAQKHFDQSIATQLILEDGGDTDTALKRGLLEELNIERKDIISYFKCNEIGDIYISKQYAENPELWNREIVVNYCVLVKDDIKIENNFKVNAIEWIPWSEFCDLVRMQPNNFTKSVRIYAVADSISTELYKIMNLIINGEEPIKLKRRINYLSLYDYDLVTIDNEIEIYRTNYIMRRIENSHIDIATISDFMFCKDRSDKQFSLVI